MEQEFIENELVILTKATLDRFLKEENPADLIALYTFFYYTAKWQKTNIVKATSNYVKTGLSWGIDRLRKAELKLIDLGLIEKLSRKGKDGKITGWYIKVNYIFKKESVELVSQITQKPHVVETTSGKQETNALSTSSLNALSTNNIITLPVSRGKTPATRLLTIYKDCFKYVYGFDYKPMFARDLKFFKDLLQSYTELQLARMLTIFFSWHGMEGTNDKDHAFYTQMTFPITFFKTTLSKYEAYIRNVLKEDFENEEELLINVGKYITNLK